MTEPSFYYQIRILPVLSHTVGFCIVAKVFRFSYHQRAYCGDKEPLWYSRTSPGNRKVSGGSKGSEFENALDPTLSMPNRLDMIR